LIDVAFIIIIYYLLLMTNILVALLEALFARFNEEGVYLLDSMMRVYHCGSPACTVYMLTDTTNWRYSSSIALSPLPRSLHQSLILSHFAAYVHLAAVSARAAGFGETVVEPV